MGNFFWQNISMVKVSHGFTFVAMTTRQTKLTPFVRRRKCLTCLSFVVERDRRNFFHYENFPDLRYSFCVYIFCMRACAAMYILHVCMYLCMHVYIHT